MTSTDPQEQGPSPSPRRPGIATVEAPDAPLWGTLGAAAGILFVVLLVAAVVTSGNAPTGEKSAAEIVKWYSDHRTQVYASAMLGALASLPFFWFLAHVRQCLAGRSVTFDRLRDGFLVAGLATATIGGINALPQAALAVTVNRPDLAPDVGVVRMLNDLYGLFFGPLTIFLSLTMAIFAAILLLGGIARRWVGWIALGSAVASLIGGCAALFPDTDGKPMVLTLLGLLGLVLFLLSVLISSIMMLRGAPRGEVAA